MGEQEKRWTIFLSYSSRDRLFADRLYQKLCNAGITVWYDQNEISIGDSIPLKIGEGLSRSDFLLVVLSEAAIESNWVIAELTPKILHRVESQKVTILPIVLGNVDPEGLANYLERTLLAGIKWLEFPQGESSEAFDNAFNRLRQDIERQIEARNPPLQINMSNKRAHERKTQESNA